MGRLEKKHILDFRQMQEQCLQTDLLANCQHDALGSSVADWVDSNNHYPHSGIGSLSDNKTFSPYEPRNIYIGNWPQDSATRGTSLERVFTNNATIVHNAISTRRSQISAPPATTA
ncbi:hypothetical protein N7G274_008288 [Stereocaulon virgatum]|uniref:Integrase catalytic domain-containing protein n=1 Tax=Stereocaulon virgatum TaxID=373712 RepID=A0ABR4A6H8_9LECA